MSIAASCILVSVKLNISYLVIISQSHSLPHVIFQRHTSICLADLCDIFRCRVHGRSTSPSEWDVALCKEDQLKAYQEECFVGVSRYLFVWNCVGRVLFVSGNILCACQKLDEYFLSGFRKYGAQVLSQHALYSSEIIKSGVWSFALAVIDLKNMTEVCTWLGNALFHTYM